jgi:putative hydrolases of HD superfamily
VHAGRRVGWGLTMNDRTNANLAFILATLPKDPAELISPPDTRTVTDAVIHLGDLAMKFGRIDRTACYHPYLRADGTWRKETDTDHTVMLGWVACAIADRFYPGRLDVGLVAQLALVHDAVEVYAGDTQTLRISKEERQAKHDREADAAERIAVEFGKMLPWFPEAISMYEHQDTPEARFVRALDKSLPKITHLLDQLHGLAEFGITLDELAQMLTGQTADIATYAGEFRELTWIREELTRRLLNHPRWQVNGYLAPEDTP